MSKSLSIFPRKVSHFAPLSGVKWDMSYNGDRCIVDDYWGIIPSVIHKYDVMFKKIEKMYIFTINYP